MTDQPFKTQDFDFTAPEVLKTLRPSEGKKIEYIGSATSDFQAEPLLFDAEGKPMVFSDWELELQKNIEGKKSKILAGQAIPELPRFHTFKEGYIRRSAELGENMFRFSLDFARLCPEINEFNDRLMADYVRALALIRAHGQEPMLAIYHWPMPKYLLEIDRHGEIKAGGWENSEVAKHFRFYVENVVNYLSNEDKIRAALKSLGFVKDTQDKFLAEGLAKYFLSINEPTSVLSPGYLTGVFPPFKKDNIVTFKKVLGKLVETHDIAQSELKKGKIKVPDGGEPQVGVAHNWTYFDGILGKALNSLTNRGITRKFERGGEHSDFLGLQYYFRMTVPLLSKKERVYGEHPDFGDIYPPGIYHLLKDMHQMYPQKEIFVTEFGFSDKKDVRRPYWIMETVRYVLEAKKQGVPVKGMLLWSLVNNFEWARGMEQKFGLFNETELRNPLEPSAGSELHSWEVWRVVTRAVTSPTEENLNELQKIYERSKEQFARSVKN